MLLSKNPHSNIGELVVVGTSRDLTCKKLVTGWSSFPGVHGFHIKEHLTPCVGILLDHKDTFYHVFVLGRRLWIEFYWIHKLN